MANRTVRVAYFQDQTGLRLELYADPAGQVLIGQCNVAEGSPKGSYFGTLVDIPTDRYLAYLRNASNQTLAEGTLEHTDAVGSEKVDDIDAILTATHGTGPWNNSGVGPHQLLLTFVDEDGPLAGVRVAVKVNGITVGFAETDADGLAELNVSATGTYRIIASLTGYYFGGADLVVTGDMEEEYEMTPLSPSILAQENPDLITGWVYCYNDEHELAAGIKITGKLTESNQGGGTTWSEREFTMTSSAGPLGLITRGFLRGATYQFNRGVGGTVEQEVPLIGDSFALKESIGLP